MCVCVCVKARAGVLAESDGQNSFKLDEYGEWGYNIGKGYCEEWLFLSGTAGHTHLHQSVILKSKGMFEKSAEMLFCGITWSQEKSVGAGNLRIIPPCTSHWGGLQKNEGGICPKGRRTGKNQNFSNQFHQNTWNWIRYSLWLFKRLT